MKQGDVVRLKTGGPAMVINATHENGLVTCVWFVGNDLRSCVVAVDGLAAATVEVLSGETVGAWIHRVLQIDAVSGDASLLLLNVVSATIRRAGKSRGERVDFVVEGGRKLSFWSAAEHGPFIKEG